MRFIQHSSCLRSTDSCSTDWISCRFFSPSAASDGLVPAPPIGLSSWSRASARSDSRTRSCPPRAGLRRDKPGHGVTAATPGRRGTLPRELIIVRMRSRLRRLPNRGPLFEASESAGGSVLGPTRGCVTVCQGQRALTQRSPRPGRFTAMRVQSSNQRGALVVRACSAA